MARKKILLLIGIDKYDGNPCLPLNNAVHDLVQFRNIMTELYGFTVYKELYDEDATRSGIIDALDSLCFHAPEDSDIIIYFAGHGGHLPFTEKGYWKAIDYKKQSDRIDNSSVYDSIKGMHARHILLISDSCYSGTFITKSRDGEVLDLTPEKLEEIPSRWVFVSCGEERVSDGSPGEGSPFSKQVCKFLQDNQIPKIPASSLFQHVCRTVRYSTGKKPDADIIECEGNEGGQMVFTLAPNKSGDIVVYQKPSFLLPEIPSSEYLARTVTYYEHQREELSYFFQPEKGRSYLYDTINSHQKVVLLGTAGSGKSVELLNVAHKLKSSSEIYVPIYKKFNTYTGQKIAEYMPDGWDKADPEALVLLLDGLDEIQSQYFFTGVKNILEFADNNPAIRIIISCRTNFYELPSATYSGTIKDFSVFTLNDISLREVSDYADRSLEINGIEFIKKVHDAALLDLVQKPYFLSLISQYYLKNGQISSNKTKILEEAILNYYATDKEHYNTSGFPFNKQETFERLKKIAFVMEVMGRNYITDDELYELFPTTSEFQKCRFLPAFRRMDDKTQWMFEHNNIQEFLAAQVLSGTSFDDIINIISVTTGGKPKVRPTWVNTISFFISIDNSSTSLEVLNWIIANDSEVIIRFEADRLSKERRIGIFKEVFEFYSNRQIWLNSNKFSSADLVRFGKFEETIDYLLGYLNSDYTQRIPVLNALKLISYFDIDDFPQYSERIKGALLALLKIEGLSDYDVYSVFYALANLRLTDNNTVDLIVAKYRKHKNQYIRAGLYKLISNTKDKDRYIDILLEGLDLSKIENAIDDRESVNLMDESRHLTNALQRVKTLVGLKTVWKFLINEKFRGMYDSDYKELITALIENSVNIFKEDTSIYDCVRNYYIISEHFHANYLPALLLPFFEKTHTLWNLFVYVWKKESISDNEKIGLAENLVTGEIFEAFIAEYETGHFQNEDARLLHEILFLKDRNFPDYIKYREKLENVALKSFDFKLEIPNYPDWNKIHRERSQIAFNMLFDIDKLFEEITRLFNTAQKEELGQRDLFDFRSSQYDSMEATFAISALDIVREFTYREQLVDISTVKDFIYSGDNFENYQIGRIYELLHRSNKADLKISEQQLAFIKNWVFQKGNLETILWYFIFRFDFNIGEERILDLTTYYDYKSEAKLEEPGTIEQLEHFIGKMKLRERVIENLNKKLEDSLSWLSNAGYAIRNGVYEAYNSVLNHLKYVNDNEYKYNEVLEFWFDKTKDGAKMRDFIEAVHSQVLLWKGIQLLYNSGLERDFLIEFLGRYMNNPGNAIDYRLMAANYLMEMNKMEGLAFCHEYIMEHKEPLFDFRHNLNRMSSFKDAAGLPMLMELLYLGKRPEFQMDKFNSLESEVISTLFNIGISSDNNLIAVREAITTFISNHSKDLSDLNFLNFTIIRMEEQLGTNKSQNTNLKEALSQWNNYVKL